MKKSPCFDFFNRRPNQDFEQFIKSSHQDQDYIDWNDYALPAHYGDAEMEYHAIRDSVALFDVSPIRKYRIQGADAGVFLDYLLTRPVSGAPAMRGIYVAYCNQDGSLKDDSILYKFADDDYFLMPSDIDHSSHFTQLRELLSIAEGALSIIDCTDNWAGIAVQGPMSAAALSVMGYEDVETLKPFEVMEVGSGDSVVYVARMGFTADLGYECWFARSEAEAIQDQVTRARETMGLAIPGYGLAALEACRLEGGFIVAGWDFSTEADPQPGFERNPYEVGLGWLVNLKGEDFFGRDALLSQPEEGWRYILRSLQLDCQSALDDGASIYADIKGAEVPVGTVNCSAWSWDLQRTIGNASIERQYSAVVDAWLVLDGHRMPLTLGQGPQRIVEHRNTVPAKIQF